MSLYLNGTPRQHGWRQLERKLVKWMRSVCNTKQHLVQVLPPSPSNKEIRYLHNALMRTPTTAQITHSWSLQPEVHQHNYPLFYSFPETNYLLDM